MTGIPVDQRHRFVGASEIAALLGVSRFQSRDHLMQLKMQKIKSPDLSSSEAVQRGHRLEPTVLAMANDHFPDVAISDKLEGVYVEHASVAGMGSSPDAFATWMRPDGLMEIGVLEAKTTRQAFWMPKDGSCPTTWFLQVMAQLACSDSIPGQRHTFGIVAALVNERDLMTWFIRRDRNVELMIESAVRLFWQDVDKALKEDAKE